VSVAPYTIKKALKRLFAFAGLTNTTGLNRWSVQEYFDGGESGIGTERALAIENTQLDGALGVGPTSLNIYGQDDGVSSATADAKEGFDLNSAGFKYRILIVEDDLSLREFGKLLLGAQGYEVLGAEDGFEGLSVLKQSLPDIIISDLRMPNMNGFEFLSVVRRRFPTIPVSPSPASSLDYPCPRTYSPMHSFQRASISRRSCFKRSWNY
jgi:hypothetical protein